MKYSIRETFSLLAASAAVPAIIGILGAFVSPAEAIWSFTASFAFIAPISLIVGIPIAIILNTNNITNLGSYLTIGFVAGFLVGLVIFSDAIGRAFDVGVIYPSIMQMSFMGIIGLGVSSFYWLIARPDHRQKEK